MRRRFPLAVADLSATTIGAPTNAQAADADAAAPIDQITPRPDARPRRESTGHTTSRLRTTRRTVASAALAVLIGSATGAAPPSARAETAAPATADGGAEARVATVERVVPPRRRVFRHRFHPWSRPGPSGVREIIRMEARRWHIDSRRLARRVACESRFHWWAGSGGFRGVLQFHTSTFSRGLRTIKDRRVVLVRQRLRTVREMRIVHYSDGRVVRESGRRRRQRVVHVYVGMLPRRPELSHTWTQLRIGSQSIRGVSAVHSSEWSCPA
jgi:hypothetical protein